MEIIKGDGGKEPFNREKLRDSLINSGTTAILADSIVGQIEPGIKDGNSTSDIYKTAYSILNKKEKKLAVRYSIRRSLLTLGPTGFPFEDFIAEVLKEKGYQTVTRKILNGKCVEHEVDVVAYNKNEVLIIEAKFHNELGAKSDTKVVLYIKSRFDDLESEIFDIGDDKRKMTRGVLITNTKFTSNAKKYVKCVGTFDVISWSYPPKGNLYDLIIETGAFPVTSISILSKSQKRNLVNRGLVNCKSLKDNTSIMREVGIDEVTIKKVVENIGMICSQKQK